MIRSIEFNRQRIPLPVPIQTLPELFSWVHETLMKPGQALTRVVINLEPLHDEFYEQPDRFNRSLLESDQISFKAEQPDELLAQCIDLIYEYSRVMLSQVRALSVDLIKRSKDSSQYLLEYVKDADMLLELYERSTHFTSLKRPPYIGLSAEVILLRQDIKTLRQLMLKPANGSNAGAMAQILLNCNEPTLRLLVDHCLEIKAYHLAFMQA